MALQFKRKIMNETLPDIFWEMFWKKYALQFVSSVNDSFKNDFVNPRD